MNFSLSKLFFFCLEAYRVCGSVPIWWVAVPSFSLRSITHRLLQWSDFIKKIVFSLSGKPHSYPSNHHHPHHHLSGPGIGVRLNSGGYQPPKMTSIRYVTNATPDREAARVDKFKSLFAEPSLDMSMSFFVFFL